MLNLNTCCHRLKRTIKEVLFKIRKYKLILSPNVSLLCELIIIFLCGLSTTVLPAKSNSDVMFCLQSYQGLIIDRSLVY